MRGIFETVTIWNRYTDPTTKKHAWKRTVLKNCSWLQRIERSVNGQTAFVAGTASVLIQKRRSYLPSSKWDAQEDKSRFFTLQPGDLIAKGEQEREITGVTPDTFTAVRDSLLPEAFTVAAVQDNSEEHKRGRHYRAEGV